MKKFIYLATAALLLTACSAKSTKTNTSTSQSTAETTATTDDAQYQNDLAYALYNPDAEFPQLSKKVADNEAEVILQTSKGDITLKLFPEQAPLAVENFLTHAKEGYYDGVIFHRVIKDFMIQTGDPDGTGMGGTSIWNGKDASKDSGTGFVNEPSAFLYHIRGALAMANAGANTNGSQFYIVQNKEDQSANLNSAQYPQKIIEAYKNGGYPSLDNSYTVFGQVIDGMKVVDDIAAVKTSSDANSQDKPLKDITIKNIKIVKDYDFSKKK